MASHPPDPRQGIVVGVDIGMTCTGVSICSYDRLEPGPINPTVIQKWPGSKEHVANKVPTKIAYEAGRAMNPHSWGFECPSLEGIGRAMVVKDLFKFFLDETFLREMFEINPRQVPGSLEDVKLWYRDFLTSLYKHIARTLDSLRNQADRDWPNVEYIFSLPTSWEKNRPADVFAQIIDDAGFGTGHVTMGLTEGEAAAVYTIKRLGHRCKEGDALIVCDAGGGSTDMCSLRIKRIKGEYMELESLSEPRVLDVGSVSIDEMFEDHIAERISGLRKRYPWLPSHVAHQLAQGDFQAIKTSFGTAHSVRVARLLVPGLAVESGERVELPRTKLKEMFDHQISRIFEFIDKELEYLHWARPGVTVSYLVLSGGLCSSPYVQSEIANCYGRRGIKLLHAKEPEELPLAVCKGIVIDRIHRIYHDTPVIPTHYSSPSYGVLCRERCDKKHTGQDAVRNPLDGHKYTVNRIDWLVQSGQRIAMGGVPARRYSRLVSPDTASSRWLFAVVTAAAAEDTPLPSFWDSSSSSGIQVSYYMVTEPVRNQDNEGVVRKRLFKVGPEFWKVNYDVQFFLEHDGPRFQISVHGDSQTLDVRHEGSQPLESMNNENGTQDGFIIGL